MKVEGTFKGHTTGGGGMLAAIILVFIIGAGVLAREGSRISRDAGHAAETLLIAAMAVTAVVIASAIVLIVVARRHEARWMAEHANRPVQLPYERRAAAPSAPRREIHVYHHLDGLPRSVADSPVTAEILHAEVLDADGDR